jgi:hypothetical protein
MPQVTLVRSLNTLSICKYSIYRQALQENTAALLFCYAITACLQRLADEQLHQLQQRRLFEQTAG